MIELCLHRDDEKCLNRNNMNEPHLRRNNENCSNSNSRSGFIFDTQQELSPMLMSEAHLDEWFRREHIENLDNDSNKLLNDSFHPSVLKNFYLHSLFERRN